MRPGLMLSEQMKEVLRRAETGEPHVAESAAALADQPGKASALHLTGLLALAAGDSDRASALIEKAAAADAGCAALHNNLGITLSDARPGRALVCFREASRLAPAAPEPLVNLGALLRKLGDADSATAALKMALHFCPDSAEAHLELGKISRDAQDTAEAEHRFTRAAALASDPADADFELGRLLQSREQLDSAAVCFERTLVRRPHHAGALCAIAELSGNHDPDLVTTRLRKALKRSKSTAEQSDLETALGSLARLRRDTASEEHHYRRALYRCPDHVAARVNLAKLLLLKGNFTAGWRAFEWRWLQPQTTLRRRNLLKPLWAGEPLHGASILLHAEQGYGDAIQFARYVALVAAARGHVILEVRPPLVRLMKSLAGVTEVIATGEPAPRIDWHCPLMSLPFVFCTTLDSIPATVPYLSAPQANINACSSRFPRATMRVGLVWAGSAAHPNDSLRSMASAMMAPLEKVTGATFISLQQGDAEPDRLPFPCFDAGPELSDFSVTAAAVASLDLVISVDTSVAHLAGSLAKPVWILLPFAGEYRWLADREDSPWYPTARLFRQPSPGAWAPVIERVVRELEREVRERQ